MSAILAFPIQALVNRAEARRPAAIDRDQALVEIKGELEHSMRNAIAGTTQFLPAYVRKDPGVRAREVTQHATEAMIDTLDHMETAAAFWDVLKSSTCPMVQALRDHMSKGYAQMYSDEIAEARGL